MKCGPQMRDYTRRRTNEPEREREGKTDANRCIVEYETFRLPERFLGDYIKIVGGQIVLVPESEFSWTCLPN